YRYRLDDAVRGAGVDLEARRQPSDALTVQGIDLDRRGAEQAGEAAALAQFNRLADGEAVVRALAPRRAMIHPSRLFLQFAFERAAEGDIQLLHAAADGEQRHARREGGPGECDGGLVAGR